MKVIVTLFLAILSLSQGYAYAQSEEVKSCLKMISDGKVDDVKRKLPDLLAEYPDDPGVMLVHASVLDDAYRATGLLEKLIKRYPDSQWTDNAYWRVIQFYAVAGDTTKAKQELEGYRQKYPSSPYLLAASDVVRTSVMLARSDSQLENTIYSLSDNFDKKTADESKPSAQHKAAKESKDIKEIKDTKPAKEVKKEEPKAAAESNREYWGLQVGIYSSEEAAESEKEKFKQQRLRTDIMPKEVDGARMYAVVIGNYSSRESAEQAKTIVQEQCSCNPIIFKK